MNSNNIKTWLSQNKVCFVTNSMAIPSTLLIPSLKTYIEYIPIQNFWLIPGIYNNESFYGFKAFLTMLQYMLNNNHFDYVIYIDEDCFINDFESLIEEFKIFCSKDYCLAGVQDGGVICHRNHSKFLVNTFLSFWNIKLLREKNITFDKILSYINDKVKSDGIFSDFYNKLKFNEHLFSVFEELSTMNINAVTEYRNNHNSNEPVYCDTVRNDVNNPIEPNQIPYTYDDDNAVSNFEPYYIIEQALIILTESPIYYMFATDLCNDDYIKSQVNFDISGLTSAVYARIPYDPIFNEHKLIAVHTWFSRAYTKWPSTPLQLAHTKRINTIIKEFSKI